MDYTSDRIIAHFVTWCHKVRVFVYLLLVYTEVNKYARKVPYNKKKKIIIIDVFRYFYNNERAKR